MSEIKDFDILRPPANFIKLGGEEVDISYIPCALTFDVDDILENINKYEKDKNDLSVAIDLADNDTEDRNKLVSDYKDCLKKMFYLSIDLCVLFCSMKHPTLTKDWFLKNTDPTQVRAIVDEIKVALNNSYNGVKKYGKNLEADKM